MSIVSLGARGVRGRSFKRFLPTTSLVLVTGKKPGGAGAAGVLTAVSCGSADPLARPNVEKSAPGSWESGELLGSDAR